MEASVNNPAPGTRGRDGRDVLDGLEWMTEGPWRVETQVDGLRGIVASLGQTVDGTTYLIRGTYHVPDAQVPANATAIARVPDLIAEVKALRDCIRTQERAIYAAAEDRLASDDETTAQSLYMAAAELRRLLPTPSGEDDDG